MTLYPGLRTFFNQEYAEVSLGLRIKRHGLLFGEVLRATLGCGSGSRSRWLVNGMTIGANHQTSIALLHNNGKRIQ